MPDFDLDDLEVIFSQVERTKLATILDRLGEDAELLDVAEVLNAAAQKGRVPDADYDAAVADFLVNADELEKEGFEPAEAVEGMRATRTAKGTDWEEEAKRVDKHGDVSDVVDFYNRLSDVATRSLKNPTRTKMPGDTKLALTMVSEMLNEAIEQAAINGDRTRLNAIKEEIARIEEQAFRQDLQQKLANTRSMMDNTGEEYEDAREYVLSEENTPVDVQQRTADLFRGQFDVTIEQAREIAEDAQDWMEEYREATEKAQKRREKAQQPEQSGEQ